MGSYTDYRIDDGLRRLKRLGRHLFARRDIDFVDIDRRVARLRRLAWIIDAAMRLPGTRFRFGLNSVLGLPPALGDAALAVVSLYFVVEAARLGVPSRLLYRMLGNVAVETALGAVPVAGDLLNVAWKANLRNIELLERHYGITPR